MIKKITLLSALLLFMISYSQNTISVPFTTGFLGTYSGSNVSPIAYSFGNLGIKNVRFTQTVTGTQFVGAVQGNDIPGNVILVDNSNVQHTIPGVINWRGPSGGITTMAFLPSNGTSIVVATNGNNGAATYTIKGLPSDPYTAIGLTFNGRTLVLTEGGAFTGNAATNGLLDDLNGYLGEFSKLSISSVSVTEGPGLQNANLTVSLTPASTNTVTVDYTTNDNSAVKDTNYTTVSGNLSFAPGDTNKTVTVSIIDNSNADNGKTMYVNLSNPTNASIVGTTGTVTINDTDQGGTLNVTDASKGMQFQVAQNPVLNGNLVLQYANQKDGKVSVFDAQGKSVKTFALKNSSGTETVDVSSLPKGIYIVVLNQQSKAAVVKIQIK